MEEGIANYSGILPVMFVEIENDGIMDSNL